MWECACGADNSASSPSCTTCGRIPGLEPAPETVTERWDGAVPREAPDPAEAAESVGGPRRRRALPFSAAGRRAAGASRPPAGAPGPTRPRPEVRPAPALRTPEQVDPDAPGPDATGPAPAPAAAAQVPKAAGKKRSFFDPDPEPVVPTASERRRRRITPTFVVAVLAIVVALGVLAYFIATTGNTKPPDQSPTGALIVPGF